jgi:myosin-crossreactive antigen
LNACNIVSDNQLLTDLPWIARRLAKGVLKRNKDTIIDELMREYKLIK